MDSNGAFFIRALHADKTSKEMFRAKLENSDDNSKIEAIKNTIISLANGEDVSYTLMPIIQFALPSKNKMIKKLLLLFFQSVNKKDETGKLLHEMILVWYNIWSHHLAMP